MFVRDYDSVMFRWFGGVHRAGWGVCPLLQADLFDRSLRQNHRATTLLLPSTLYQTWVSSSLHTRFLNRNLNTHTYKKRNQKYSPQCHIFSIVRHHLEKLKEIGNGYVFTVPASLFIRRHLPWLFSIEVTDVPILSAAQASFAVRWETMDTMVCSIFSGAKSEVCASVDRLRAPLDLEICGDICSFVADFIPVSGAAVVVVVGSVVGGWKVVSVSELGLAEVIRPAETMAGDGVSPVRGPRAKLLSGKVRGMSVWMVSQVSEAESGFLEIGDAS